jgi:ABC-type transporter Mla MlaB component
MHGVRKVRRVDAQCLAVLIDSRDDVRTTVQRRGTAADPTEQFEHP